MGGHSKSHHVIHGHGKVTSCDMNCNWMQAISVGLVELQRVGTSAHFRAVPNARLATSTFRNRGPGGAYRITAPFVLKTNQSAHH